MKRRRLDGRQAVLKGFAKDAARRGRHFLYIRIPEAVGSIKRGSKYEDPLKAALGELGEITGGGSQMGKANSIAFCGIDVEVMNRNRGLEIIRRVMRDCGAPVDTIIEEYLPKYRELPL